MLCCASQLITNKWYQYWYKDPAYQACMAKGNNTSYKVQLHMVLNCKEFQGREDKFILDSTNVMLGITISYAHAFVAHNVNGSS
jgi:hypothetical protein